MCMYIYSREIWSLIIPISLLKQLKKEYLSILQGVPSPQKRYIKIWGNQKGKGKAKEEEVEERK